MSLASYNLMIRFTDGSTAPLEFTAESPSAAATAATRKAETGTTQHVEAVAVLLQTPMVWLPRYDDWWHLLPDHVRRAVPEPQFGIETRQPEVKPLDPPAVKDTLL